MYIYDEMEPELFTNEGIVLYKKISEKASRLLESSGAFTMENAISGNVGDCWLMLACVDKMVELGSIREIHQVSCAGQHRVFVKGKKLLT